MKIEIRANGIYISGYVNVPGRESRPVITPRGKVIEIIEQRAFERALARADNIDLKLDHEKIIASTRDNTLRLKEDAVGLRAECFVTDQETIEGAKKGKIKGWSFNMMNVKDKLEERAGELPIRKVSDFTMSEVTLALKKTPIYSSTSLEIRTGDEIEVEQRASEEEIEVIKQEMDYKEYEKRIETIKSAK